MRLLRAESRQVLNTSNDRDPITSLHKVLQHLTTFMERVFSLVSNHNYPLLHLRPLALL